MKKLLLILVVVAMAAPLYAAGRVQFSVVDNADGSCTITYDANSVRGIAPVAMGLTVKVTSGNPIKSVTLQDPCDFMEIFMDAAYSIESDPCDPCHYEYGEGTPIADPCGPGEVSLVTHGNHFVLSFGGLGGETAKTKVPPMSGTITLYADTQPPIGGTTSGTIKLDARRGGVIGDDGEPMETNLDDPAKAGPMAFTISECYQSDYVAYTTWRDFGKPYCWCYKYNCRGDTDNLGTGIGLGKKWVVGADLSLLANSLFKRQDDVALPANYQCANFDRIGTGIGLGKKWVVGGDLGILAAGLFKRQDDVHFTTICPGW